MFSALVEESRKSRLLAASTLATVLAGTGMAMAQPGSAFQDQGIRETIGSHLVPRAGTYVMQRPTIINPRDRAAARYMREQTKRRR
jgi:hypothetical protein